MAAISKSRWLALALCSVFLVACSDDDDDDIIDNPSAPTVSQISNQTVAQGNATAALPFTVGDADTNVSSLTVSGSSSNTTLVPNSGIVFGGSGAARNVTVTPAAGQSGTAVITYAVSDGTSTTTRNFQLTVSPTGTTKTFDSPADAAAIAAALANVLNKVDGAAPTGGKAGHVTPKIAVPCQDGGTLEQTSNNQSTTFAADGTIVFTDCQTIDEDGNDSTIDGQMVLLCADANQTLSTCGDQDLTFGQESDPLTTALVNSADGVDIRGDFFNFLVTIQDDGNEQTETLTIDGRMVITDNSTNSCGSADLTVDTVEPLTADSTTDEITAGELDLTAADGSTANVVFNADGSQTITVNGVSDTFDASELATICGS